jgi:UDP-2-acetamido-3-amino-2,3-dideoxy-glucuronate N-acetyltransferase
VATYIHPTAEVSDKAILGENCKVWHQAQVREGARLGDNCIVGKAAYIDRGVQIGRNCKIQNRASLYHGVTIEDGVFVGPHVCFTNDLEPRAINPDGNLKSDADWSEAKTLVRKGAALGANSTIVAGVTIGQWAMVGAGAVVTHDVPDYGLIYGNPARLRGYVGACGHKLHPEGDADLDGLSLYDCAKCGEQHRLPLIETYKPTEELSILYCIVL